MVLKGVNWVHNAKIKSNGLERIHWVHNDEIGSNCLEMSQFCTQYKNQFKWSSKESIGYTNGLERSQLGT